MRSKLDVNIFIGHIIYQLELIYNRTVYVNYLIRIARIPLLVEERVPHIISPVNCTRLLVTFHSCIIPCKYEMYNM